jgi:hypothetical protein
MFLEEHTKRVQEELGDNQLRVEFNEDSGLYEIMKWIQTGCDTGYFNTQATFTEWGEHVYEDLRRCRPGRESAEEVIQKIRDQKAKIQAVKQKEQDDLARTAIFDMHGCLRPVKYFYSKGSG